MVLETELYETKFLTPKSLLIDLRGPNKKKYLDRFHIESVNFNDDNSIKLGDKIPVTFKTKSHIYDTYFKANYIYKDSNNRLRINEFENTLSTTYILPLLSIQKKNLLMDLNFINCYISHHNYDHSTGDYIYLIYRYTPTNYYSEFCSILKNQKNFISFSKEKDKRFDCFIFETKECFVNDINLILEGKYSLISNKAKQIILNFHNQQNSDSPLYQILFKGRLRRNELQESLGCSIPDDIDFEEKPNINKETWKYECNK
jgi:hypothetical protein